VCLVLDIVALREEARRGGRGGGREYESREGAGGRRGRSFCVPGSSTITPPLTRTKGGVAARLSAAHSGSNIPGAITGGA
jgi:hypothetical protein